MDADHLQEARPAIRAPYRLQWEAAQAAWVMLYPEGMVKLSASAGEIMRRCDGRLTVQALIDELEAAFNSQQIRQDVIAFIGMAAERGWLALHDTTGVPGGIDKTEETTGANANAGDAMAARCPVLADHAKGTS